MTIYSLPSFVSNNSLKVIKEDDSFHVELNGIGYNPEPNIRQAVVNMAMRENIDNKRELEYAIIRAEQCLLGIED
jgi:hypothetical protein